MKALVYSPNRYDGILDVGIFKFGRFIRLLGFDVSYKTMEGLHYIFTKDIAWIFPKRIFLNKWSCWNITYIINHWKLFHHWDLLLCDSSHMLFFANRTESRFKIYRMNDLLEGFGLPEFFQEEEREFIDKSDIILAAHTTLGSKVKDKSKFFVLPNPIDLKLFPVRNVIEPEDIRDIPRPRIVYVGAVYGWFDWEGIVFAAKNLKGCSFVIIGPYTNIPTNIPKNVYILGKRPHKHIHRYLYHSDVGIIPFKLSPLITNMDYPNKVLEYFAMGLPVVSVFWENFQKRFPEVLFYKGYDDMIEKIRVAIKMGKSWDLREKIKDFSTEKVFMRFRELLIRFQIIQV